MEIAILALLFVALLGCLVAVVHFDAPLDIRTAVVTWGGIVLGAIVRAMTGKKGPNEPPQS